MQFQKNKKELKENKKTTKKILTNLIWLIEFSRLRYCYIFDNMFGGKIMFKVGDTFCLLFRNYYREYSNEFENKETPYGDNEKSKFNKKNIINTYRADF